MTKCLQDSRVCKTKEPTKTHYYATEKNRSEGPYEDIIITRKLPNWFVTCLVSRSLQMLFLVIAGIIPWI